ncbi:MAG TPA: glyoxylate/hydroxypyruvate reductase GhrB [Morganella sp. (in: Bacteria)]|nr:glyoxylate/hydroxypyruvate reductase GhrB [Morganella sp. (in: enterobacteria)]
MKPSVVVYRDIPDDLLSRLSAVCDVHRVPEIDPYIDPSVKPLLAQADAILGSGGKIDTRFLTMAPKLRVASTITVGYDNFDVAALSEHNVVLMHTPDVLTETVADATMALVLATARRMIISSERVKRGEWTQSITPDWYGCDVHHKTMGIVGMGRIGDALARRAHCGFGMNILYHARSRHEKTENAYQAQYRSLDALLSESDFVCITLPLTKETHHLFGREQFEKMKRSAILVNIGRGAVIDETALAQALADKTILAAGLDVFEQEPLSSDSPLLSLPNVVLMPHIGSATHETRYAMAACAVDNVIRALNRDVSQNCVNPQVLQH